MKKKHTSNQNSKNTASLRDDLGRFPKGLRSSPATEFKKGQHWRPHSIFRERDYLARQYVSLLRSASDIAKEHGVTEAAILFWLGKHKIPRRSVSEVRQIKHWGSSGSRNPMYGKLGAANPRWIDGSSPERQSMYARFFWKELVRSVLKRDGYLCGRCGCKNSNANKLHAHHVKPWAGNPDSRFDQSNIITVCKHCHNWIHSKKNTANEYLSTGRHT